MPVTPELISAALVDYVSLFRITPQPLWAFDVETLGIVASNEAAELLLGFPERDLLKLDAKKLTAPQDLYRFNYVVEKLRGGEMPSQDDVARIRFLDRDRQPMLQSCSWSVTASQNQSVVLVSMAQIPVVRKVESQALEHTNFLDLASDAILVCDLAGRITFWNQGATRLYGWTREEVIGASMVEILMKDCVALAEVEEGVRGAGEWSGELSQVSKRGDNLIVNSRWTLVRSGSGEPRSVLVINTDLTETKRLEKQFLRAQRLESIGTLASGIAHDLNNILSPIMMSVGLLRRTMIAPDQERMLGLIEGSAERGAGIVQQVLTFARGIEGERVLLQPKHLIEELVRFLRPTFPKNIDIQTQFPLHLWTVMGDATQLHQILLNLCVNARDAMVPSGGILTIGGENAEVDQHFARMNAGAQLGDYVVLRVTDTGIGMAPETVEKIFDPFFTTKEVGKGTGLGLATVMGLVKSHGGFLTVQSEPGAGTTFRIFIPATRTVSDSHAPASQNAALYGRGELVLVVDDEAPVREALVQTLQEYGYRVYTAEDGSDALALYVQRKGEISAVITDLAMGLMDGIALVRSLRRYDSSVKVIVSAGYSTPEQAAALSSLGVKTFLDKPYNAAKLLTALRTTLDGTGGNGKN